MAVKEDDLIDVVKKHFSSDVIELDQIESIHVNNPKVTIIYSDGTKSVLSPSHYLA
jgi:hypothetical protein